MKRFNLGTKSVVLPSLCATNLSLHTAAQWPILAKRRREKNTIWILCSTSCFCSAFRWYPAVALRGDPSAKNPPIAVCERGWRNKGANTSASGSPRRATALDALGRFKRLLEQYDEEARVFGNFPSLFLGLVADDGAWEHYDGHLRCVDGAGNLVADRLDPTCCGASAHA